MIKKLTRARAAVVFVASMVCVCAAAEAINFVVAQQSLHQAGTTALEDFVRQQTNETLMKPAHVAATSLGSRRYTLTVDVTEGRVVSAVVEGSVPTLFLRHVGVESLPLRVQVRYS